MGLTYTLKPAAAVESAPEERAQAQPAVAVPPVAPPLVAPPPVAPFAAIPAVPPVDAAPKSAVPPVWGDDVPPPFASSDHNKWVALRRSPGPFSAWPVDVAEEGMADEPSFPVDEEPAGCRRQRRRPVVSPWQKMALSSPNYDSARAAETGDLGPLMEEEMPFVSDLLRSLSVPMRVLMDWTVSFFAAAVATALALGIMPSAPWLAVLFVGLPALLGAHFVIRAFMPGLRNR